MTPVLISLLGRTYGGVTRDLLLDLRSRDRSIWEDALDELIFRHMLAGGSAGIALTGVAAVVDEYAPRLYPVVVGIIAGILLALLLSLLWLTAQGQRAKRLDQPPDWVLDVGRLVGLMPVMAGVVAAMGWVLVEL